MFSLPIINGTKMSFCVLKLLTHLLMLFLSLDPSTPATSDSSANQGGYSANYSVSKKSPPPRFSDIFPMQTVGNF